MTSEQVGGLMLVGLALIFFSRRKKRQNSPARGEMVFIEMIEIIEVRSRPKAPAFVVNMAIVAVIVAFVWVMNR